MADVRCEYCKHYAELKEPYTYQKDGYPDGVTVFGFCGKNCKNGCFYPVYIPDGGVCKDFNKKPGVKAHKEYTLQATMEE